MSNSGLFRVHALILFALVWAAQAVAAPALPDFTTLVEQHSGAVVNIGTTRKVAVPHGLPPRLELPDDERFGELFRRFFGDGQPEEFDATSLGSGFVISSDGYIVTNHHVVKDADEIIVRFSDRREMKAELIGSDPKSDVALLKVEATGLPVLKAGSSRDLKVGEWVLAIGSPFGFELSVTSGIVSAKGRSLPTENYVPFIQTDVAINPGNSGGPLFNMDGEVVGINAQIYSQTGGFMGLSFAIPIEVAMDVVEQIKTRGYVTRGWLGVYIQEVTQDLAESFGMEKPAGSLVAKVLPESPAEKAGIQVGDVIVSFDGKPVASSAQLPPLVGATRVGTTVPVKVIRDGRPLTLKVKIEELPPDDQVASRGGEPKSQTQNMLGIEVTELDAETRKAHGMDKGGVIVTRVGEGPARDAGIRRGDLILMLDGKEIDSIGVFREAVQALPKGKSVPVLVQRDGSPIFLALKASD